MKKSLLKFLILISFTISGCSLDLKTKDIVKSTLKEQSVSLIDNYFDLNYVENHALAFGLLGNIPGNVRIPLMLLLTISVTLFGSYMIWRMRNRKFRLLLPFFILMGGAFGNILDRMLHGFVTDFFHLHYYYLYNFYVFNVADVLINIGIILIVLQWKDLQVLFDDLYSSRADL